MYERDPKASDVLLSVRGLKKYFPIKSGLTKKTVGYIKAVDGLNFDIKSGKTFGLVGESGCGKSTTGRTLLRLLEPTEGEVIFNGENILTYDRARLRQLRTEMQIIFQDPYSSLNSRMTVGEIVGEALLEHGMVKSKKELHERVVSIIEKCGLSGYHMKRYPHEFSGGQRQRICIARALALRPKFVVCDEAVSALDVSIQSHVINLLKTLQDDMNLTYLFISHDLGIVKYISDNIGVMYLGRIAEMAEKNALFDHPMHPYTQALLSAIPKSHPLDKKEHIILQGDMPSPANPPSGCGFHTRCPKAMAICSREIPVFNAVGENHYCACHLYNP
ncbi:ABC transporter ATP-binding protein [Fusibacter ferrireducens]|uniref:ATP-binding cassette domain-containing protein n=1 Tax=Fusibacter ferrireducens TaxID=2785058 RepID=A0ABR9ZYZ0_9FIRM|nr:oligopeptide/dipeptide ABC transporter ATP-binding protein [Fusibacter ferrireducens]MBF4695683.1 ATP-binding cassette domain-containing protein [Fusibacter ferrireducens]